MKKLKLSDLTSIISTEISTLVGQSPFTDLEEEIQEAISERSTEYVMQYAMLGMSLIGNWEDEFDPSTEIDDEKFIKDFVRFFFVRDFHYFRALNGEFAIAKAEKESTLETKNKNITKSASEVSPINSAEIGTSPVTTDAWNIDNPNSKSGANFVGEGSHSQKDTSPEIAKIAYEVNFKGMNLNYMCKKCVRSFVDEFNMSY